MVEGTDIEVVEIEQDGAVAAPLQLRQKLPLRHLPRQLQV
jgi:hypothetical protein